MFKKNFFVTLALCASAATAGDYLEPCIDSNVSSSGVYPDQHTEDFIIAARTGNLAKSGLTGSITATDAAPDEEICWVAPEWRDPTL